MTAPDGSRFLLVPTGGAPIIDWVIVTPAGVLDDPPGLEGLSHAAARAAQTGPLAIGSRDPTREKAVLERVDELELEAARVTLGGQSPSLELREQLENARSEAKALCDTGAFELALRAASAIRSELTETPDASLWHLTLGADAVGRVAALVVQAREASLLRGVHEHFRQVRAAAAERHRQGPFAAALEEVIAQHYLASGHPYARALGAALLQPSPLSHDQALAVYRQTHEPARTLHVLCGGLVPDAIEPLLRIAFARSALKPAPRVPPPPLRDAAIERRSTVPRASESAIVLAWRLPGRVSNTATQGLVEWLFTGPDAAFARGLRRVGQPGVLARAELGYPGRRADGLLLVEISPDPDAERGKFDAEAILRCLDDLLVRGGAEGPAAGDLLRVHTALSAAQTAATSSPRALALSLAKRCGIDGMTLEQALAPTEPAADELRQCAASLREKNRPAIVIMEPKS